MTDARAVSAADLGLLGAAAAGQLADRYRARGGWRTVRTDRPAAAGAGTAGRVGGGPPVDVSRRARRLVTAGLLKVAGGQGFNPRPYRLTEAGYAILRAHSERDLRRWWMSGLPGRDDMSFYPTRTARQAQTRHRAASPRSNTLAAVRPIDGPLTTGEVPHRSAELDAGWAHAWALAARRQQGEVPTGPVDAGTAARLLPAAVRADIAAHVNARNHQRLEYVAAGLDPPDVLPSSPRSWHAWLGTAAAAAEPPTRGDDEPVPGLTPVHDGPPPPQTLPAPAAARAFPPLHPGEDGPAPLHASGPVIAPAARPDQTRHGPRR
jgi:hypothetical protein